LYALKIAMGGLELVFVGKLIIVNITTAAVITFFNHEEGTSKLMSHSRL